MVRRRSSLKFVSLKTFFFMYNLKKKNRSFLKYDRSLFFLKRKKLFTKKRRFNFNSVLFVFFKWQLSLKLSVRLYSNTMFFCLSPACFEWYGFIVQKTKQSLVFLFFSFSFLFFSWKIKNSLNSTVSVNSFFFNLNSFSKKKNFVFNYFLLSKNKVALFFLNKNLLLFSPHFLINFYRFTNLLIC